jgi:hypothetical protein
MEGYCSTGQSSQWAVVPMEEEEVGQDHELRSRCQAKLRKSRLSITFKNLPPEPIRSLQMCQTLMSGIKPFIFYYHLQHAPLHLVILHASLYRYSLCKVISFSLIVHLGLGYSLLI